MGDIIQLPKEFYFVVGFLIVSNLSTIVKLWQDGKNRDKEKVKEETATAVELALIKKELQTITVLYGKMEKQLEDLKDDFDGAYGKWRETKNGAS